MAIEERAYFRMPLGYGPFPGPRQTASGGSVHGWDEAFTKSATIVFQTSRTIMKSFLPHSCFDINTPSTEDDTCFASISFVRLENLPWLAGHGYNHCGLYIHDVVCTGANETICGKYLSVLFENRADPIISGREELGFAKLFATIDETETEDEIVVDLGWEHEVFGRLVLTELKPGDIPPENLQESFQPSEGLLHFKYIPRTGEPGVCDVQYPTFSPQSDETLPMLQVRSSLKGELQFRNPGFKKLPTLHHVAEKLASVPVSKIVSVRVTVEKGAGDMKKQRGIVL